MCGEKVYKEGYCYDNVYYKYEPDQISFPYEILSLVGALILAVMFLILALREFLNLKKNPVRNETFEQAGIPTKSP